MREQISDIKEEMEKDGFDLVEQVIVLTMGGVLGGQAYQIAQQDQHIFVDVVQYLIVLTIGIIALGVLHFTISYYRID